MLEEGDELVEYFLALLDAFLEDFFECFEDFLSSLFLSLFELGLESSTDGDLDLLEDLADFFFGFGIRVEKLRGPPDACMAAAG